MTNYIQNLTLQEADIVAQCLRAAVEGPFFAEWEFQTLVGVSRDKIRSLAAQWQFGESPEEDMDPIVNVLNNLTAYLHGQKHTWASFIKRRTQCCLSYTPEDRQSTLRQLQ